jgi:hypothetical protein
MTKTYDQEAAKARLPKYARRLWQLRSSIAAQNGEESAQSRCRTPRQDVRGLDPS